MSAYGMPTGLPRQCYATERDAPHTFYSYIGACACRMCICICSGSTWGLDGLDVRFAGRAGC